jgi:hypothetical protein
MNFSIKKIKVETVVGSNENMDSVFFEYLNEYSISYKINEDLGENGYPIIDYEGGPISLTNMLKEKFGMEKDEIEKNYPDLNEQ